MTIQGFVRKRQHQFGRQSAMGTPVACTRAYPFKGVPSVNLNWTDPDVDVGSFDPVAPPYRTKPDLTASLTDPSLKYNNIPLRLSGILGGNVTPTGGGAAKTWDHKPSSTTVDPVDLFTYRFGDDVLDDWYRLSDGVLESVEITGSEGLGPLTVSDSWRFGSWASTGATDAFADYSDTPTPGLSVSTTDAIVYLKDIGIYIGSDPDYLASNQIMDALHSFVFRITQEWDQKMFANGDQEFDIDAYGRGARVFELQCTFAKTADTVGMGSESDAWMSDEAVNRFVNIAAVSKTLIPATATPYSWSQTMPMRYYTREEGEVGGNSTIVLTGRGFLDDADFGGVYESICVNSLATL